MSLECRRLKVPIVSSSFFSRNITVSELTGGSLCTLCASSSEGTGQTSCKTSGGTDILFRPCRCQSLLFTLRLLRLS